MAKNSGYALFIVSCEDADALFAVHADCKQEANRLVTEMIKEYATDLEFASEDGEEIPVPESVKRVLDLRNKMKRKVRIGAMLKSEPQLLVDNGMIYSLTDD